MSILDRRPVCYFISPKCSVDGSYLIKSARMFSI